MLVDAFVLWRDGRGRGPWATPAHDWLIQRRLWRRGILPEIARDLLYCMFQDVLGPAAARPGALLVWSVVRSFGLTALWN